MGYKDVMGVEGAETVKKELRERRVILFETEVDKVFFFSSRRRHTRSSTVSWARKCV